MTIATLSFADAGRLTLPALLERRVEETPDAVAVMDDKRSLTYIQWLRAAKNVGVAIREHGQVGPGDRLLMWLPSGDALPFVTVFHGALDAGAVVVPADDRLSAREILALIRETAATAAVISPAVAMALSAEGRHQLGGESLATVARDNLMVVPIADGRLLFSEAVTVDAASPVVLDAPTRAGDPDACAFLGLTSGSTGRPKGVMVGHGATVQLAERMVNAIFATPRTGKPLTSEDVLQSPIPCYLTTSIVNNLYPSVLAGCPLVYEGRRFDPQVSERRMVEVGTTIYNGASAHYAMMCRLPLQPGITEAVNVDVMISAGSPLSRDVYTGMRARWPRTAVANWYALNETLTGQTINIGHELDLDPTAVGRPVWPTQLKIVDDAGKEVPPLQEGEVLMQAEGQMLGYWGQQNDLGIVDGWIHTGDRGYVDKQGLLHIVGRMKERINRGGYKFYPIEIEKVLLEHPHVSEAAVIRAPHPELGDEAVAFVVLDAVGDVAHDEQVLKNFCRDRIARHKVPSRVISLPALPRSGYAKVQKTELLRQFMNMANNSQDATDRGVKHEAGDPPPQDVAETASS